MFKILKKQQLADNTKLMEIYAPLVAKKSLAGQFVVLRINEKGERIPLTIADFDVEKGTHNFPRNWKINKTSRKTK